LMATVPSRGEKLKAGTKEDYRTGGSDMGRIRELVIHIMNMKQVVGIMQLE
jgi:hypothetical protein